MDLGGKSLVAAAVADLMATCVALAGCSSRASTIDEGREPTATKGSATPAPSEATPTPAAVTQTPTAAPASPSATATAVGAPTVHVLDPAALQPTKTLAGRCWTGSELSLLPSAWRCIVGNLIYDPCYLTGVQSSVVCPTGEPPSLAAVRIDLTEPLDLHAGNPPGGQAQPLKVVLTDGRACYAQGGGTFAVDGKRANFACDRGRFWLLGQHEVQPNGAWTWQGIAYSPGQGTPPNGAPLQTVTVVEVWEG